MTDATAQTRGWVRDVVRSGLLRPEVEYAEVRDVIAADHPALDAEATAREWIAAERAAWVADAAHWASPTDYDRLQDVLGELARRGFVVLQGCVDHWSAKDALEAADSARAALWFTPADIWHAIDEAMLEVNLWHPDTANAAPGDALLDETLAAFAEIGLGARFDEGRIEISARWQRIPG